MEPFDILGFGEINRVANKVSADALPLEIGTNCGVEQEGMLVSVPRDVDKADKVAVGNRTHVTKVLRQDYRKVTRRMVTPCVRKQCVERVVVDVRIDLILCHTFYTEPLLGVASAVYHFTALGKLSPVSCIRSRY